LRESDRRGTAARDSYERENSFVGKKEKEKVFYVRVKMEDLVRAWEKRQTQSNNKKAATIKTKTKTSFLTTDAKPPGF